MSRSDIEAGGSFHGLARLCAGMICMSALWAGIRGGPPAGYSVTAGPIGIAAALHLELAGDVTKSEDGIFTWGFSLTLSVDPDIRPALEDKEEWIMYPEGQLPSMYRRTVREGRPAVSGPSPAALPQARQPAGQGFRRAAVYVVLDIGGLSRPGRKLMERQGFDEAALNLFEIDEHGRFRNDGTRKLGDRLVHWLYIAGEADPFVYKVRFTGEDGGGRTVAAEFVFDSRDWAPAGRDSTGQVIYRKIR